MAVPRLRSAGSRQSRPVFFVDTCRATEHMTSCTASSSLDRVLDIELCNSMPAADGSISDSTSGLDWRDHPTVFYDGDCALCNGFVQWVIARDRTRRFRFASLQGETAAKAIGKPSGDPEEWTIILLDDAGMHERSDAALRIMRTLGGVWRMMNILRIIPRSIRDRCYRFIARRRFRWFGKATNCRLPSDDERKQMLP
jgi:predicted DCC family thiol-disulfide oxidoreductase YuxK